jgi:hypothetical protein
MRSESPSDTKAGLALWSSVVDNYDLTESELVLLRQAVATVDTLDELAEIVKAEGPMQTSPQGARLHPALQEIRQLRIVLARLLGMLKVDTLEDDQ